jgi:hypothetical protein
MLALRHAQMRDNPNTFLPKTERARQKRAEEGPPFREFYEGRFTMDYAAGRRSDYYKFVGRDLCDWFGDKKLGMITRGVDGFRHAKPADFRTSAGHKGRTRGRDGLEPFDDRETPRRSQLCLVAKPGAGEQAVIGVDRPKTTNKKTPLLMRAGSIRSLRPAPWLQPVLGHTARGEIVARWGRCGLRGQQVRLGRRKPGEVSVRRM